MTEPLERCTLPFKTHQLMQPVLFIYIYPTEQHRATEFNTLNIEIIINGEKSQTAYLLLITKANTFRKKLFGITIVLTILLRKFPPSYSSLATKAETFH